MYRLRASKILFASVRNNAVENRVRCADKNEENKNLICGRRTEWHRSTPLKSKVLLLINSFHFGYHGNALVHLLLHDSGMHTRSWLLLLPVARYVPADMIDAHTIQRCESTAARQHQVHISFNAFYVEHSVPDPATIYARSFYKFKTCSMYPYGTDVSTCLDHIS